MNVYFVGISDERNHYNQECYIIAAKDEAEAKFLVERDRSSKRDDYDVVMLGVASAEFDKAEIIRYV